MTSGIPQEDGTQMGASDARLPKYVHFLPSSLKYNNINSDHDHEICRERERETDRQTERE